jgi:hypothetical protein
MFQHAKSHVYPTQGATAAAPIGRQDFLIPRAGNQQLRSCACCVSIYACVGGSIFEYDGSRAAERFKFPTVWFVVNSRGLGLAVWNTADSDHGATPIQAHLSW